MTGYPALTQDSDLDPFPGAPFATSVIRSAEASVRNEAGWHIAPVVTESMVVEAIHPSLLTLKSLRVVSVASVTDEDGNPVTDYKVRPWGVLVAGPTTCWTLDTLYTVVLTHGYDSADDLLSVVAARCQREVTDATLTQQSETVGQRTASQSYNIGRIDDALGGSGGSPLDRYRLHTFR